MHTKADGLSTVRVRHCRAGFPQCDCVTENGDESHLCDADVTVAFICHVCFSRAATTTATAKSLPLMTALSSV